MPLLIFNLEWHLNSLNNMENFLSLIKYFKSYTNIPHDVVAQLKQTCSSMTFAKNQVIHTPTFDSLHLYFIIKGCLREFVCHSSEEITLSFSLEQSIVGLPLFSSPYYLTSQQYLQALEETWVVVIPVEIMKELNSKYPEMLILTEKLLWEQLQYANERNFLIRLNTAKDRIKRLYFTNPEYFHRIPLRPLSSFLGMRMETMSRLRSKLINS